MTERPKKICSACGTSPINHNFLFISNFLDETIGNIGGKFFHTNIGQEMAGLIEKGLHILLAAIGFIKYSNNVSEASNGRSRLIWEEALRRGIVMEQVVVWGKPTDNYRAKIGGQIFYFESLPIPPWLPASGHAWIDDKFKLFAKLSRSGIPVPVSQKISKLSDAKNAFELLNKPVIIKPKSGSRGRHTTTNINTLSELESAFSLASQITPFMVIQEHLSGSVYRATVIHSELAGFYRADPPSVTGNNLNTIGALIEEKNINRNERLSPVEVNDELISFIARQGYTLHSVLPADVTIALSAKTGRMYGGYTKEMLPDVHPKMHSIFKKAGELVSAPVVGFDLIIEDPRADPDHQRWGIIECNSLPFIDLHYFALDGEPINLAKNVWDLWVKK